MEWLRQVIGLEYQVLVLAAAPLTSLALGWALRQVMAHLRDRRVAGYTARLVAWAQQAIPDKSARYGEVAALLSRRFPMLSSEQLEVLIESEVHALKSVQPSAISSQRSAISRQPPAADSPAPTSAGQPSASPTGGAAASTPQPAG